MTGQTHDQSNNSRCDDPDCALSCKLVWDCLDHRLRHDNRLMMQRGIPKFATTSPARLVLEHMGKQRPRVLRLQEPFNLAESSAATIIDSKEDHVIFRYTAHFQDCMRRTIIDGVQQILTDELCLASDHRGHSCIQVTVNRRFSTERKAFTMCIFMALCFRSIGKQDSILPSLRRSSTKWKRWCHLTL